MTISYSDTFVRLLFRWKGSLWKAIWRHLLVFLFLYYAHQWEFIMTQKQQEMFVKYVILFDSWTKEIPLTFLLGFYVAMIIRRWWDCCQLISWPDHLLYNVSALIRGNDVTETRPVIRGTIAADTPYCHPLLAWGRSHIVRVLARYPTDEHLLDSGLINKEELALFKTIHVRVDPHQKWFVPINWIQTMMVRCFEKGTLGHTNELRVLLDALEKYRNGFFQLFIYDWIAIPLVYTQVCGTLFDPLLMLYIFHVVAANTAHPVRYFPASFRATFSVRLASLHSTRKPHTQVRGVLPSCLHPRTYYLCPFVR
ncbi:Bestrophin [Cooperia oncophora]